jgi:mono/diheme cytochrome c family protein
VIELMLLILLAVLPMPGTQFKQLPSGAGKAEVEAACYACHSADLLAQQRLTEKQWLASVEKMIRWGADVPPEKKDVIVAYLSRHFGPANRFVPTKTAPVR